MCEVFPHRRQELDSYQRDIIEMATRFPGMAFYDYHKAFSGRAATLLSTYNVKIDWSVKDTNLFCSIFAGHKANACAICSSQVHITEFCPQVANSNSGSFGSKSLVQYKGANTYPIPECSTAKS
jgi:hypothetical protein